MESCLLCLGLLGGGGVTLLYIIYSQRNRKHLPPLNQRGLHQGSYIKCPYCNHLVTSDANRCPHCEHDLTEVIMPVRAYRPGFEEKGEVSVCIRCGRLNNPNRTECKTCHSALERAVVPKGEIPAPPTDDGETYQL